MTLQAPGAPELGTRDAAAAASRVFVCLREVFGTDLRCLALFRVALARGLLCDPCWRWNRRHRGPERLESLRFARAIQVTAPPGEPVTALPICLLIEVRPRLLETLRDRCP